MLAQPAMQGFKPPRSAADPTGQRRTRQVDAMTGEDLRLPIKRGMIAVFCDQHLGDEARGCQAVCDQPLRCSGLHDVFAGAAGVLRTQDTQHPQLRRNPVEHLADALTDGVNRSSAARTSIAADIENDGFARKMVRQRLARR